MAGVEIVEGNPTCEDLGYHAFSFKIDPPTPGTYDLDGLNTVTITTADGIYVDWASTLGMDAVIVKGGPMANIYRYDPERASGTALSPPINDSNGIPYAISHIDFCFDYELAVTKTADTSLKRTYTWSIDKSAPLSTLVLATGQSYLMPYTVVVTRTGYVESDWAIAGVVTIHNPAPFAAEITGITDTLAGTPVDVSCGFTLPYVLASGATVTCTYAVPVADATSRLNSVTVDTCSDGDVGGGSASAEADFGSATVTARDACVTVEDDRAGSLGTPCDTTTYNYTLQIGPYAECGTNHTFANVATYTGNDTCVTGSDGWSVDVTVPACETGCTLTPGYWKTHSTHGPAPYDDTWAQLASGADTTFFLSGQSYYQVLWTNSSGGSYYTLARAYIAAYLNGLNGASTGAISTTFAQATAVFQAYTPAQIAALPKQSTLRATILTYAGALDAYNNGLTGPGHCTE